MVEKKFITKEDIKRLKKVLNRYEELNEEGAVADDLDKEEFEYLADIQTIVYHYVEDKDLID